jgi:hypothetical protein
VGETSPHALSVRYGRSGKRSAREGPLYPVLQRSHAEVFEETEKSAHASSTLNGSATLPLQGPCAVKVETDRESLSEFD